MATLIDTLQVKFEAIGDQFERSVNRLFGGNGVLPVLAQRAALGVVAAISGMAVKGAWEFQAFEQSMTKAFRNIGDTSAETEAQLIDGVRNIATEYGISATTVADALAAYAYAGLSVEDALEAVETATRGAIAADADLTDTLTYMDGIWSAFKGQGYETQDVMDVLTSLTSNATGGFNKLADALVGVAAPAVNAGISLEEAGAAIGALTWLGVPAAEASTQVRRALQELSDSGKGVGEQFAELSGKTFKQFIADGGTLKEALDILTGGLQEGQDISQLFGSSLAGNAMSLISAGEGAEYYDKVLGALTDSSGATDKAFERMSGTIQSKTKLLLANFQEMTLSLGERLAPAIGWVLDSLNNGFPAAQAVVESVFAGIDSAGQWLIRQWNAFQTDTDGIYASVRGIIEAAGNAISAVFEFLATLWENVLRPAWEAIKPVLQTLWDGISVIISNAWDAIRIIIETALNLITGVLNAFASLLRGDWQGLWDNVNLIVQTAWNGVIGLLQVAANAVLELLGTSWAEVSAVTLNAWNGIKETTAAVWQAIKDALAGNWEGIADLAGAAWARVVGAIQDAWSGIGRFFADLWNGVNGIIQAGVNAVITGLNGLINAWNGMRFTIPTITVPGISFDIPDWLGGGHFGLGPWTVGGQSIGVPQLPSIPMLASGGIVDHATLALIGEAGPEAVIPLDRLDDLAGGTTVIVELDGRVLMQAVAPRLVREARLKTGLVGV
ncbi:MAG: phage tail tape measure protein [Trueperaceae bacterium]|nr:phage tail tape measure protein [Trueperaceae bacterium]